MGHIERLSWMCLYGIDKRSAGWASGTRMVHWLTSKGFLYQFLTLSSDRLDECSGDAA